MNKKQNNPGICTADVPPRSADVPSAVSGTSRPYDSDSDVRIRNRGCLPHWEISNGIYFITYRLADSLPPQAIEQIKLDLMKNQNDLSENQKRISILYHHRIEKYLDSSHGECHLANQQIAELTANAIRYFDGERYQIFAWCIMPNWEIHAGKNYAIVEGIYRKRSE